MIRKNALMEKMKDNGPVFGPFVRISSPAVVEILGYAGFDFLILDMEHGPLGMEKVEDMVRAAAVSNITPLVRVRENNTSLIQRALDAGAQGVLVPQIVSGDAASYALKSAYYHPRGKRGVCRFVRSANYSAIPREEYFSGINDEILTILAVEGKEAVENLDRILANPHLGVLFIGPYDMSQSMGVPGQTHSEIVKNAMKDVIRRAKTHGVMTGTFVDSLEGAKEWIGHGVKFISFYTDTGLMFDRCRQLVGELKAIDSSD